MPVLIIDVSAQPLEPFCNGRAVQELIPKRAQVSSERNNLPVDTT